MKRFSYLRPKDVDEAVAAMRAGARPLAGGTDLLTLMKPGIETPEQLVDLKRLEGIGRGIDVADRGLTIGALTTLAAIETDERIVSRYTALAQAAGQAATVQLRNVATLGGNLLQQPRCWYFRRPQLRCWRRGGEECHARDGENRLHALFAGHPCCAVHPSDPASALVALDASVRLRSPEGEREVALGAFLTPPEAERLSETGIAGDEVVTSLTVPDPQGPSVYLKAMDRHAWAFALAAVAARVRVEDGQVVEARIVLGGVAPVPWRVPVAEQMLVAGEAPAQVARAALADAEPLRHNGYKVPLTRALVRRAVSRLTAHLPDR